MNIQFWAFTFLCTLCFSCGSFSNNKNTVEEEGKQAEAVDSLQIIDSLMTLAPKLLVKLERKACYGRCPVYDFVVYSNGDATYEGKQHVERHGIHLSTLTNQQLLALMQTAKKTGLFEMEDKYPQGQNQIADLPSYFITYVEGGQKKSIHVKHDAPQALTDFEKYLDELIGNLGWQLKVE